MPTSLTNEIIAAAILGFEEQKRHIDTQIAELRAALSGSTPRHDAHVMTGFEPPPRRKIQKASAGR